MRPVGLEWLGLGRYRFGFGDGGQRGPSEDGGLLGFFEFCFTRAARSATLRPQLRHQCLQLIELQGRSEPGIHHQQSTRLVPG